MTRLFTDYLRDILDSIEKIQKFVAGVDFDTFQSDDEKTYAVIRALEIIGEATKHIPQSERARYPQIPWIAVAGMRDKLIHGYHVVSLTRVWETIERDLMPLYEVVSQMLEEAEK